MAAWVADLGRLLGVLALAAGLAPAPAAADEPDRQLLILLRALAYDKAIDDDADGQLTIAALYRTEVDRSARTAQDLVEDLRGMSETAVAGLRVRAVLLPWEPEGNLDSALAEGHVDVVYLSSDLHDAVGEIVGITRSREVLTLTAEPDYVYAGASLCVSLDEGRPRLIVNLPSARAEGSRFGAQFLDLATVIR